MPVSQLKSQDPLQYEKKLVFVLVVVPDELSLHLGQLHMLAVELPDDVRVPVFLDLIQGFGEVDWVLGHRSISKDVGMPAAAGQPCFQTGASMP